MKKFRYTLYSDGESETCLASNQASLTNKLKGIFIIETIEPIRKLSFGGEIQLRQDIIISAPKCFTKEAIYTIMNSFKPQPLQFI